MLIETTDAWVTDADRGGGARGPAGALVRKATVEAINAAFASVEQMAGRTAALVKALQAQHDRPLPARPDIEFGVSFNGELEAYIAKVGPEGTISVRLGWDINRAQHDIP